VDDGPRGGGEAVRQPAVGISTGQFERPCESRRNKRHASCIVRGAALEAFDIGSQFLLRLRI
jgi:hypothetical protein